MLITSGFFKIILYLCILYILYIITKRHYDVDGTTVTIKNLKNPIDIKDLEDLSIVPVFNENENAIIVPIEDLLKATKNTYFNSFYLELDSKDRITAISPWDSYLELMVDPKDTREMGEADKFRLSKTPQKQLEYGKIAGLDDTKVIRYDKHDIATLDTTPVEVGCLNDILESTKPALKKFYKHGMPNKFVVSVNKVNIDGINEWELSGRFHQDVVANIATFRRPYTKSTASQKSRDIRMIIVESDSYDESGLTEFARSIDGDFPSMARLDTALHRSGGTGLSSELPIDIIKLDKGDKPLIGILFDNHKIFHATPRTSLSLLEFFFKKAKIRTLYQVTFSDGFADEMSTLKASKKKKKKKSRTKKTKSKKSRKKSKKSRKKSKKYKIEFEN